MKTLILSLAIALVLQVAAGSNTTAAARGLTTEVSSPPCSSCTAALAAKGGSTVIQKKEGGQTIIDDKLLLGYQANGNHVGFMFTVDIPASASSATSAYLKLPQGSHKGIHLPLDNFALTYPRLQVNLGSSSNVGPQSRDDMVKYEWRDGRDPWVWYLQLDAAAVAAASGTTVEVAVTTSGLTEACPSASQDVCAVALEYCTASGGDLGNSLYQCDGSWVEVCQPDSLGCEVSAGELCAYRPDRWPELHTALGSPACPVIGGSQRIAFLPDGSCASNARRLYELAHCGKDVDQLMEFYSQTSDRPAIVFE